MATFHAKFLLQLFLLGQTSATQLTTQLAGSQMQRSGSNGSETEASTIVMTSQQPKHHLMICNAYAGEKAMDVYDLNARTLLTSEAGPLPYKACSSYKLALGEGEQFEFRMGNLSVGVFRSTGVPRAGGELLLIAHRRSPTALNAAFESHAFAELGTSQLVVLDVYRGKEAGKLKIMDVLPEGDGKKSQAAPAVPRLEDLKFNSVVQVPPGDYKLILEDASDKSLSSVRLHIAKANSKFVVLRTGNQPEANASLAFPQELVLQQQLDSGTCAPFASLLALAAALVAGLGLRQ